ncbi:MAG: M81 family metallopeptidase [Bacillota bacterium]|nr:M81 family metallopeptidase [Bacillota bacterium]
MQVVVFQFIQETNSFSPVKCGMDMLKTTLVLEDEEMLARNDWLTTGLTAMVSELRREGIKVIPSIVYRSVISCGPVSHDISALLAGKLTAAIREHVPVDGVFMSLHGATQLENDPDGAGYFIEAARIAAGEKAVIAVSFDFHANITRRMVRFADVVCGYKTYPHTDYAQTSQRAALLGIDRLLGRKPVYMAHVKLPMIHQAEACLTTELPMKTLVDYAGTCEKEGVYDVSIFQMQPWLDVPEGGASVVVVADSQEKADHTADKLARRYWEMRDDLRVHLYSVDEVIDMAMQRDGKPVVLSDSADSPSAGSPGDSTTVLSRILARSLEDLPTLLTVVDPSAAAQAMAIGVGAQASFTLGGAYDKLRAKPITLCAMVKSLHDGDGVAVMQGRQALYTTGNTAVLRLGEIYIVVTSKPGINYHPDMYRNLGLNPALSALVMAKSASTYREYYRELSDRMYTVDTPGASSANLLSFTFSCLPRPIYPLDDIQEYRPFSRTAGHQQP